MFERLDTCVTGCSVLELGRLILVIPSRTAIDSTWTLERKSFLVVLWNLGVE